MRQPVVSALLRPGHDRHTPVGRIDDQRLPLHQLSVGDIVRETRRAGAAGGAVRVPRIQTRFVAGIEYFERRRIVVRPGALKIRLAVGGPQRRRGHRRVGCARAGWQDLDRDGGQRQYRHSCDDRQRCETSIAHQIPLSLLLDVQSLAYFLGSVESRPSAGAPVPDDPRNNFVPLASVTSRPFALFNPSFAW